MKIFFYLKVQRYAFIELIVHTLSPSIVSRANSVMNDERICNEQVNMTYMHPFHCTVISHYVVHATCRLWPLFHNLDSASCNPLSPSSPLLIALLSPFIVYLWPLAPSTSYCTIYASGKVTSRVSRFSSPHSSSPRPIHITRTFLMLLILIQHRSQNQLARIFIYPLVKVLICAIHWCGIGLIVYLCYLLFYIVLFIFIFIFITLYNI